MNKHDILDEENSNDGKSSIGSFTNREDSNMGASKKTIIGADININGANGTP